MVVPISVCICSTGRHASLSKCLQSIEAGSILPAEVIVSEDGVDLSETEQLARRFARVRVFEGPRQGLCANRNAVVRHATNPFVCLLDDDAVVSSTFFERAWNAAKECDPKTVLSGQVLEDGIRPAIPGRPTFWGHFGPASDGQYETINLNSNLFPGSAFEHASFDEGLRWGYEDMDFCAQLISKGYRIKYHEELVVSHLPPAKPDSVIEQRVVDSERARIYVTMKRHLLWRRNIPIFLLYVVLAPVHKAVAHVRRGRWHTAWDGIADVIWALGQLRRNSRSIQCTTSVRSVNNLPCV